jgi:hypothetical protein
LFLLTSFFDVIRHTVGEKLTYIKKQVIMWYGLSTLTTAAVMLIMSKSIHGTDWTDYGEPSSNVDTAFDDDSDQYLTALARDEEHEIHSPLITGYKYVSGNFNLPEKRNKL